MREPLTSDVCSVDAKEEDVLVCSKPRTSLAAAPSRAPVALAVAAVAAAALLLVAAWMCFPSGAGSAARAAATPRASDFMQASKAPAEIEEKVCPTIESQGTSIRVQSGQRLIEVCFDPTSFEVEVERGKKAFVATRLMTGQNHALNLIEGSLTSDPIAFEVEDGIDHVTTIAELPEGEKVPIIFSVKGLKAVGQGSEFKPGFTWGGKFEVPGEQSAHDEAGEEEEEDEFIKEAKAAIKEQMKGIDIGKGTIEMKVKEVNARMGEISGVFVAKQFARKPPSDMEVPKAVRVKGNFYGKVE